MTKISPCPTPRCPISLFLLILQCNKTNSPTIIIKNILYPGFSSTLHFIFGVNTLFQRMPGKRSRQGCGECRKRRRKCDETKPSCGQCVSNNRTCQYELRLVWSQRAREPRNGMLNVSIEIISLVNCDVQLPAILSA
jgi:hypothetical protein